MDLNTRVNNMLKFSGGSWVDTDTGEIIAPRGHSKKSDFMPVNNNVKSERSNKMRSFDKAFPPVKLPKLPTGLLINLAVVGGIGLIVYKLYTKFFGQTAIDKLTDKGDEAIGKTYKSDNQTKADQLGTTAASLQSKGLTVSNLHKSLADTFHNMLDSTWVDHDKIVKTILNEDVQTFRLVSVAYGTRDLNSWTKSLAHIFDSDAWSTSSLFSSHKNTGTLKDHLRMVLSDDEQSKISSYLAVI